MKNFLVGSGCNIEYYNTTSFKEFATKDMVSELFNVAVAGFGVNQDLEDVTNHVFDSDNIGIVKQNGVIVGFATTKNYHQYDLCYLHGIAMSDTGKGVGSVLLNTMFSKSGNTHFGFTT